jgi:hypothetical protein
VNARLQRSKARSLKQEKVLVNHVTVEQEASSFGVGSSPEGNLYARKALVLVSIVAKRTLTHNGAENSNYLHDVEGCYSIDVS